MSDPRPPIGFEIIVHLMELMVVFGIGYTIYFLRKVKKEKLEKNESRNSPKE